MEKIEYSAKDKKDLTVIEWRSDIGKANSGLRVVKMVRPICDSGCQFGSLEDRPGWWEYCTHGAPQKDGSPYWRMRQHIRKVVEYTPILDEDGKETGEFTTTAPITPSNPTGAVAKVYFELEPNITEVPHSVGHNSGEGVDKMRSKGFVFLVQAGIAPMCELKGCGKAFPSVRTDFGDYCSENHARIAGAREQEIMLNATDPKEAAKQLRTVEL